MGQQRYELDVLAAIAALETELTVNDLCVRSLRSTLDGTRRTVLSTAQRGGLRSRLAARVLYRGFDVVHRGDLRLPPSTAAPEVLMIHDLAFLSFPDEGRVDSAALDSIRRARTVIVPSEWTRQDVMHRFGHPDVRVASPAPAPHWFDGAQPASQPYVLHAGGATLRKNLGGLASAWPQVRREHPNVELFLVGPEDHRRTELFRDLEGVVLRGSVPQLELERLVRGAAAVVVPSLHEGFGLPAVEAMAAGTPVVAARTSSLVEVVGDAAILVDPDHDSLAEGLITLLADDAKRAELRRRGPARARDFSWQRAAEVHLQAWTDAAI